MRDITNYSQIGESDPTETCAILGSFSTVSLYWKPVRYQDDIP